MKFAKTFLTVAVLSAMWVAPPQAHAGVSFTTLVNFTFTNAPNYGQDSDHFNLASHPSALVQGNDGNFYGSTIAGGRSNADFSTSDTWVGEGTVFKMTPDGAFTSLYSFGNVLGNCDVQFDGAFPGGNLIEGADGNLYGTTFYGGTLDCISEGTIFQITTSGTLTTLYSFGHNLDFNTDGGQPAAGVVQGGDGNFYGTTSTLGANDGGTVFQFIPDGTLNTLYSFPTNYHNLYGNSPYTELVEGTDGNLYGTTQAGGTNGSGTVFQITTGGALATLHSFDVNSEGSNPSPLVQGTNGNLYGTLESGSDPDADGYGAVFRITTNGVFTLLHRFTNGNDGGQPLGGLIQGSDGNFYGTTQTGGAYSSPEVTGGTVFRMTPTGTLTTLYAFSGPDGQQPQSALVQGTNGSFYGTTATGGSSGYGTIFRITIPPAFQSITKTNGQIVLTWCIMPGQAYQLQYTGSLTPTNWLNLGSLTTAATPTVTTSDTIGSNTQRFYRVMSSQ